MLQNLRRYFYSNKVKIMRNVLMVIMGFVVIQGLNLLAKNKSKDYDKILTNNQFSYGDLIDFNNTTNANGSLSGSNIIGNNINSNNNIYENTNENEVGLKPNNQIGGNYENNIDDSISSNEKEDDEGEKAISSFLDLCIQGEVEKAYESISDECKEILFTSLEHFKQNYYSRIFSSNKIYTIEEYHRNTYKVKIAENMNNTGAYTSLANTEYITITYTDNGIKLNINNYIERVKINSTEENDNITVKVNYKDVFMEYQKYNITINNKKTNTIMLNGYGNNDTMYILSSNGNKYYAYINEISENSLIIKSENKEEINIKYNCLYGKYTGDINKLVFANIILDYDSYTKVENFSGYNEIESIVVNM